VDKSCFVCGVLVLHPFARCGLVLCPEHQTTIARTLMLPEQWIDRMLCDGFTDHHSDVDLGPALRVFADQCQFCGQARYHCELQFLRCCDECTHPKAKDNRHEHD